ncbi:MAG: hypothetical protein JSU01_16495 [Bacteroidetes bacterium]|nr:hypothetical protein [Bacteroidota bacterium]
MKIFLIIAFSFIMPQSHSDLINSVWARKITPTANNTLTFKRGGVVLEYDCELGYAFHSTYKLSGDTITISGKDDSHSEDNGKILSYWITSYLIRGNGLYMIKNKVSEQGKWKIYHIKRKEPDYKKVKQPANI